MFQLTKLRESILTWDDILPWSGGPAAVSLGVNTGVTFFSSIRFENPVASAFGAMSPHPVCVEWTDENGDPDREVAEAKSYYTYVAENYPNIELP